MRLGGPCKIKDMNPESWIGYLKCCKYSAAPFPVGSDSSDDLIREYVRLARQEDILIAEVGAWSNPLSPDKEQRKNAVEYCKKQLHLADRVGARCCVNISGSRGEKWDGPHPDNLTDETFQMIVDTVRDIIDSVKPEKTCFALEAMPWMYPDSADSYLELIKAIDRKQFAVHLDPVNIINSPRAYFSNARIIKECFHKLGPYIKSCHAKDIKLSNNLTVHLDEVRPGLGGLDYKVYLSELNKLHKDTPLLLEHLKTEEEYAQAAEFIRGEMDKIGSKC